MNRFVAFIRIAGQKHYATLDIGPPDNIKAESLIQILTRAIDVNNIAEAKVINGEQQTEIETIFYVQYSPTLCDLLLCWPLNMFA